MGRGASESSSSSSSWEGEKEKVDVELDVNEILEEKSGEFGEIRVTTPSRFMLMIWTVTNRAGGNGRRE